MRKQGKWSKSRLGKEGKYKRSRKLCLEIFSTFRIERFNQMSQLRYKWLHQHISSPILPQPQSQSIPPTSCLNSTKTLSRIPCLMEASRAGCSWALSMISGAICNEGVDCPGNRPTHHSTLKPSLLKKRQFIKNRVGFRPIFHERSGLLRPPRAFVAWSWRFQDQLTLMQS